MGGRRIKYGLFEQRAQDAQPRLKYALFVRATIRELAERNAKPGVKLFINSIRLKETNE